MRLITFTTLTDVLADDVIRAIVHDADIGDGTPMPHGTTNHPPLNLKSAPPRNPPAHAEVITASVRLFERPMRRIRLRFVSRSTRNRPQIADNQP